MKFLITKLGLMILLLISSQLSAQNCAMYYPSKVGTITESTHYNKKGESKNIATYVKVLKVYDSAGYKVEKLQTWTQEKKKEATSPVTFTVMCKGDRFLIDMTNYLDTEKLDAYKDMEVSVKAKSIDIPINPIAGQKLSDGLVTAKILNHGFPIFTMAVKLTNRKVEGKEKITTPAGTFNAVKISYDIELKMGIKFKYKGIEWYAKDVGIVRSELWNKKGSKLQSYEEITNITY